MRQEFRNKCVLPPDCVSAHGNGWVENFSLIEASTARQAVGKRREGSLWSSLGYVGNGFLLSTYPDLSTGTRMPRRPLMRASQHTDYLDRSHARTPLTLAYSSLWGTRV